MVENAKQFVEQMEGFGFTIGIMLLPDGKRSWYWGDDNGIRVTDEVVECLSWVNTHPNREAHEESLRVFLIESGRVHSSLAAGGGNG